jgi:hypothetical protein
MFDIYLGIWEKARPLSEFPRKLKMDQFRKDYNRHAIADDPSGQVLKGLFGQEKADLYYDTSYLCKSWSSAE